MYEHKTNIWKQHLDKIDHKHNPHSMWGTIAKLSNKKPRAQQNRSIYFETKTVITDIDKATAFNKQFINITPYSTNKINGHIDHAIKNLPIEEIQLTTTQVQLAISNNTNNNSTGPDGINIRHLKHLGPLAIRYFISMYNIALNTNAILYLYKRATIILTQNQTKTTTLAQTINPYHFYHLLPKHYYHT